MSAWLPLPLPLPLLSTLLRTPPQRSHIIRADSTDPIDPIAEFQWFVKTETFAKPFPVVKPHLEAHRSWVATLRGDGYPITSGYRVDAEGKPGGGGLMVFKAACHAAAEELVRQDPLIANDCVDWQLNRWIPEVGDLELR